MEIKRTREFFIAMVIGASLLAGIVFGLLISEITDDEEKRVEEVFHSPNAIIQYNVNEVPYITNPITFLSEKMSEHYFILDDAIRFYGIDSFDLDGTIVDYEWFFSNDHTFEKGRMIERVFTMTGDFFVNLTVTDNNGQIDTTQMDFEVKLKPFLQYDQESEYLKVCNINYYGGPEYRKQKIMLDEVRFWYDADNDHLNDFDLNNEGEFIKSAWRDEDDNGYISVNDTIWLGELEHYERNSCRMSVYYYPYPVNHFGLPTFIWYAGVNITQINLD